MKKTMTIILATLLACILAVSCAFAEGGAVYEDIDGISTLVGFRSEYPEAFEGEGTPCESDEAPVKWVIPAGWTELPGEKPDRLLVAANYLPEQEPNYGMNILFMAIDLSTHGGEAVEQIIQDMNIDPEKIDNEILKDEALADALMINIDTCYCDILGKEEFIFYTLPMDNDIGEGLIYRSVSTFALVIHKGVLYQFVISGTEENNDFYPSFIKLLESVEFTD